MFLSNPRIFSNCVIILVIQVSISTSENIEIPKNIANHSSEVDAIPSHNETKTNSTSNPNVTKVTCLTDKEHGPVEIVNATKLHALILESGSLLKGKNVKENAKPGPCILVMFYAGWCVFSSQAAPHFNALPRFFPHLKVAAIDAMKYYKCGVFHAFFFNTQYGIVGIPTLMLIHNGKSVAKFNDTLYTLETFSKFLTQLTSLQPNGSLYVTSADFSGPVSSTPTNETDYCLLLSWLFITLCALYFASQTQYWKQFVELVQNTWRESNAQHEHVD